MKSKMFELERELKSKETSLTELEKLEYTTQINKCNTFQNAYKTTLNSTYGYCATKYAPLGDDDIGSSVTLTGQAVAKKSNELFEQYITENYPTISKERIHQSLIYNDTDSTYISLKILEDCGIPIKDGDGVSKKFYDVCDKIENFINVNTCKWAEKALRSRDPRFVFKRESVCDVIIFTGGKNYLLHVLDDEGKIVNKFKYKGVSVVKSTMPRVLKPYVKKIIETLAITKNKDKTYEVFLEAYNIFKGLDVGSIYKNNGVNNYEKYIPKCSGFGKVVSRMPGHAKAAYYHDLLIDKLGLGTKYQKFRSGDKVKQVYLKTPNKYGIEIVGYKSKYPPEFAEIFTIDYEKMFDKLMFSAVETFYNAVGWKLRKPNENVKIDLEDFFS